MCCQILPKKQLLTNSPIVSSSLFAKKNTDSMAWATKIKRLSIAKDFTPSMHYDGKSLRMHQNYQQHSSIKFDFPKEKLLSSL